MAVGLLGAAMASTSSWVSVYTVPSGVSHAIVHITLSASTSGAVRVNSTEIMYIPSSSSTGYNASRTDKVSMMLSPGSVVAVYGAGAACTVSGYTV